MPIAFVLLNTEVGSETDVLKELRKTESVKEALPVYGTYDIVLRVESSSMKELKQNITWKIRKMDYVTSTQTLIIF
jgi:DNA-binding Lrp family transcriptional regulator